MDISIDNLSIILGAIVPGVIAVWGLGYLAPAVRRWFSPSEQAPSSVGGTLLILVVAAAAGLLADSVRLHVVDPIHFATGVSQPEFSYGQLSARTIEVFKGIVANHFLYHEFYGNTMVCLLFAYVARQYALRRWPWPPSWREVVMVLLVVTALGGSRSHLQATSDAITELLESEKGGRSEIELANPEAQEAGEEGRKEVGEEGSEEGSEVGALDAASSGR